MPEKINVAVEDSENEMELKVKSLVTVEQLPIITEQFKAFKAEIDAKVDHLLLLEVNDDNRKSIKAELSNMRKFKNSLEERRKEIKNQVMDPYFAFEEVYNAVAKRPLDEAISKVAGKVNDIETNLLSEKSEKAKSYFKEYAESLGIDFVKYEQVNLNVTLSVSDKKLREQCKAFLNRVFDDLKMISTQEHKAEILVEYKRTLNASLAVTTVSERFKAIEAEKERTLAEQEERAKAEQNVTANETAFEPFVANVPQEIAPPEEELQDSKSADEKIYPLNFRVYGTKEQLKEFAQHIKSYLSERGMRYE